MNFNQFLGISGDKMCRLVKYGNPITVLSHIWMTYILRWSNWHSYYSHFHHMSLTATIPGGRYPLTILRTEHERTSILWQLLEIVKLNGNTAGPRTIDARNESKSISRKWALICFPLFIISNLPGKHAPDPSMWDKLQMRWGVFATQLSAINWGRSGKSAGQSVRLWTMN